MNCSTPGPCVHHQLLEFTQTHVHRVGDAIQLNGHDLSKLWEMVKDRETWHEAVSGVQRVGHNLATEHQQDTNK